MSKYTEFINTALDLVGGSSNIKHVACCATRLRITFNKKSKVNENLWDAKWTEENLKPLGCVGVVPKTDQVQFIIGPNVDEVYEEFVQVANVNPNGQEEEPSSEEKNTEHKGLSGVIYTIGNFMGPLFMPIIPALIVGGIIAALKNLAVNYFGLDVSNSTVQLLVSLNEAGFYFLPIYLGYTAAKQLKMPAILGMMLGASMLTPTYTSGVITDFFGIPIQQIAYKSTIIPIVLGCFFLKFVYTNVKKIVPEVMTYTLTPLLTMIIVVPVQLIVLGPISYKLASILGTAVVWLANTFGFLFTPLFALAFPYIVMTGLDKSFYAVGAEVFAQRGYNNVTGCMAFISNISVGAAALAVSRTLKTKEERGMIASFGMTALCGITEPSWYGALITRPQALKGVACGAVSAGLFAGIFGLRTFLSVGPCPGYLTLTYFIDSNGGLHYVIIGIITALIATVVSFTATTILLKREEKKKLAQEN